MSDPIVITTTSPLPAAVKGMFYSVYIEVTGGSAANVFETGLFGAFGDLPPGLAYVHDAGTGVYIQGTPTEGGVFSWPLNVYDGGDEMNIAGDTFSITVEGDGQTVSGYELLQMCLGKAPREAIGFATFDSDLGNDGNFISILYGAETGVRGWKLGYPILSGGSADASVTYRGVTMTPEKYLWNVYHRFRRTAQPIVITSPHNDQYYLARFTNPELEYERFLTKLFSTGVELRQVRKDGITVFDISKMLTNVWGWYGRYGFDYVNGEAIDNSGNGHDLTINGNIAAGGDEQNGWAGQRFNGGGTNTGFLNTTEDPTIYEAMFVMKMREATFSNNAGILTGGTSGIALAGASGTTKFADQSFTNYEYRLNSVSYDQDDQQAPMEEVGLVHCRWQDGIELSNLQIGKKIDTAGTFAEADIYEMILFDALTPDDDILELSEALQDVYDI